MCRMQEIALESRRTDHNWGAQSGYEEWICTAFPWAELFRLGVGGRRTGRRTEVANFDKLER